MSAGRSFPVGATVYPAGVNFSVYSRDASAIELALFDREDDSKPSRVIKIDPTKNRTYPYWHVFVPGVKTGQLY
ncbi:MAG: glycogen debranching enzyme, partial [Terriglobia bacterium]